MSDPNERATPDGVAPAGFSARSEAPESDLSRESNERAAFETLAERGAPSELVTAARAALERNARETLVLDLRGISDVTDFFLVMAGDSDTHTRAIGESIIDRMKQAGFTQVGSEGRSSGQWILLDYVNVIIHIFLPRVREFYQIERLWGDAPVVQLS